ncbi:uncharacterized protein VNE69_12063 [Vairimorpha necatrix]|uniref:Uncharacterized protein n=1 Tax=Vairimorpha necatrix TaxID=6039 RepID=A0AAX4JGQ3_9MICR
MWLIIIVNVFSIGNTVESSFSNKKDALENMSADKKIYLFNMLFDAINTKDKEQKCKLLEKVDYKMNSQCFYIHNDILNISRFIFRLLKEKDEIIYIMRKIPKSKYERRQKRIFNFDKFFKYVLRFANNEPFLHNIINSALYLEVLAYNSYNLIYKINDAKFYKFTKQDLNGLRSLIDENIKISLEKGCSWEYLTIFDSKLLSEVDDRLRKIVTKKSKMKQIYKSENYGGDLISHNLSTNSMNIRRGENIICIQDNSTNWVGQIF